MSRSIRHRRSVRIAALALGCCALIAPSAAYAAPKAGDTPADFPGTVTRAVRVGDTPADFPGAVTHPVRFGDTPVDFPGAATRAVRVGDTPADFPGSTGSRTPVAVPAALPHSTGGVDVARVVTIGLMLAALTLALLAAVAVARGQGVRRRLAGRMH